MKRFLKYAFRWQFYTPALALCIFVIPDGALLQAVVINVLAAAFFYHADTRVLKRKAHLSRKWSINQEFIPYSVMTVLKNKMRFWK